MWNWYYWYQLPTSQWQHFLSDIFTPDPPITGQYYVSELHSGSSRTSDTDTATDTNTDSAHNGRQGAGYVCFSHSVHLYNIRTMEAGGQNTDQERSTITSNSASLPSISLLLDTITTINKQKSLSKTFQTMKNWKHWKSSIKETEFRGNLLDTR